MIVRTAAAASIAALAIGALFVAAVPASQGTTRGDRLATRAEAPRTVTLEQRGGSTSTLVRVPVTAFARR